MKRLFSYAVAVLLMLAQFAAPASAANTTLRIGSDVSYAPLEFFEHKQIRGFDYDLAQALGAKMNAQVRFTNHDFNDLTKALKRGQFDAVISAYSDTRAREKDVDFLDYFLAGSGILVAHGNPQHVFNLEALCGLTVDLQKGTAQQTSIDKASKECTDLHLKPINTLLFSTDEQALNAFTSGKSVAHVSDYPVVAYLARTLKGGKAYEVAGRQFGVVPYGIAVSKKNAAMREALQRALKAIIADGTYDALLKKWGLEQGAMRAASVNAGTLFNGL